MHFEVLERRLSKIEQRTATGELPRPVGHCGVDPDGSIVSKTGPKDAYRFAYVDAMVRVLFGTKRYGVIASGRSAGKSHGAGRFILESALTKSLRILVARETLLSLQESMYSLLADLIRNDDFLRPLFDIQQSKIFCVPTGSEILFKGLRRDRVEASVKSIENIGLAVVEESQTLSGISLDILRPSIRGDDSRIVFLINPRLSDDPVYAQFVAVERPDTNVVHVTYGSNPWCPQVMIDEAKIDYERNPKHASHVWGGELRDISEAAVFSNWVVEDFVIDDVIEELKKTIRVSSTLSARERRDRLHYQRSKIASQFFVGLDHGWIHPTAGIELYHDPIGKRIFVMSELHETKLPLDHIAGRLKEAILRSGDRWPVVVDSARPDVIDHLRRGGINATPAKKVPIVERIDVLQTYLIIVHPTCRNTIHELSNYRWKEDSNGNLLPEPEKENDHLLDALSYALGNELRFQVGRYQKLHDPFS